MTSCRREISKEVYERAIANKRYITSEDYPNVFNISERCGYGVYGELVSKDGDKYYVDFWLGSSCD